MNAVQYSFLAYGSAIGGLIGSQVANKINSVLKESKTLLISVALFGVGMFMPYITSNPFVVAGSFGLSSFGSVLWNVQAVSIRQALIPDNLLGRVNSVYRLLALGLNPVGAIFGGVIVKILDSSFSSTIKVAEDKGYMLVCHTGNLIFLREDLVQMIGLDNRSIHFPETLFLNNWLSSKKNNSDNTTFFKRLKTKLKNLI